MNTTTPTPEHEHTWVPVLTHMGAYRCTVCHKVGRRVTFGPDRGKIVLRVSALPKLVEHPTYVSSAARIHGTHRKGAGKGGAS